MGTPAEQVDISGMPDPKDIGLPPPGADPTAGMPDPEDLYRKFHFGNTTPNANGKFGPMEPIPKELVDEFMQSPQRVPTARETASRLTGSLRAGYGGVVAPIPAAVASIAGQGSGALDAAAALATGDTDLATKALERGRQRGRDWSKAIYDVGNHIPATKLGGEFAQDLLSAPANITKEVYDSTAGRVLPDNVNQAVGDIAQDVATDLPALGVPGAIRAGAKVARAGAGAAKRFVAGERASITPPEPAPADKLVPPVGSPVTGDSLRAQPNPIPPPGTPQEPAVPTPSPTPAEKVKAAAEQAPGPADNDVTMSPLARLPESDHAPVDMNLSPEQRALVREGVAARRANERGSVRLFNSPKEEGPQQTPEPTEQAARRGHLDAIDQLSGGRLPTRRSSAVSGDYNETGNDWQMAETGNKTMQGQLAKENGALHAATDNVHNSIGSEFEDKVDNQTMENRGRVTRGALQAIQGHFEGATNDVYDLARAVHGTGAMPEFLTRAKGFLGDDANYMPDGFRRSALARINQLETVGDNGTGEPGSAVGPKSVGAAEKFREWLNANRTLDNAHIVKQLKDHVDTDVSDQGGPGLYKVARNLRTHQAQMLEEPTLMKQLLTASDSQGINHVVGDSKVMDKIADADSAQVKHLMRVLHAGAHLSPEIAEQSAAAIREIQAHIISRMHEAATDDGGKWNARSFYNSANKYSTKVGDVFKDRPDVIRNLKTINDAGNTLHMDKHYPGAAGQTVRSGLAANAVGVGGRAIASVAHDIPIAGRLIGRAIEGATEKATGEMGQKSLEKQAAKKIVDRTGKQTGAVGDLGQRDAIEHDSRPDYDGATVHQYKVPNKGGSLIAKEYPERGVTQVHLSSVINKGNGWGTRMLQRAADDAHARGQVLHSDQQVSEGQTGAYKNLGVLGYSVKMMDNDVHGGARHAVGDHVFEVRPGKVNVPKSQRGSVQVMRDAGENQSGEHMLNIGLHQGMEGDEGFRKMSKQEAQKAVESTGVKVTRNTVLTPKEHGVGEPTAVMSTDRPLTPEEMNQVLSKTKQSAIPQRTAQGEGSMHVARGHEQVAKEQGWDQFNSDYFREHTGQTATDAQANPNNIHPNSTVKDPKRSAYPGIYDDPMDTVAKVETTNESPHLKEIFGTTRQQMHDDVIAQGDVPPKTPIPGIAPKGKGSAHAQQITTPENAARIRNIIKAFREADPSAYRGMVAWYHMEPMYQSIKKILGGDEARASDVFHRLNTYTSLSSPMSPVGPEIVRGTAAATLAAEGKFSKYEKYGGNPTTKSALKNAPEFKSLEMGMEGHMTHNTSQIPALSRFTETGQEANAVKTGTYRRSSDAPSRPGSDFQNTVLVSDSHNARGIGLADVRGAKTYDGSAEGPEVKVVHPWYHDEVARHPDINIPATSAQAVQWAALSRETGVETPVGAPKLELFADQIAAAAKKAGVTPKEMWERIVKRIANGTK